MNNQTEKILNETSQPEKELQKTILKDPQEQIEMADETNLKVQGNGTVEVKPTEVNYNFALFTNNFFNQ